MFKRVQKSYNKPISFTNSKRSACIQLILINRAAYFQHNTVLETGLSDFYSLKVTESKMTFQKHKAHIITYWHLKKYGNEAFRFEI